MIEFRLIFLIAIFRSHLSTLQFKHLPTDVKVENTSWALKDEDRYRVFQFMLSVRHGIDIEMQTSAKNTAKTNDAIKPPSSENSGNDVKALDDTIYQDIDKNLTSPDSRRNVLNKFNDGELTDSVNGHMSDLSQNAGYKDIGDNPTYQVDSGHNAKENSHSDHLNRFKTSGPHRKDPFDPYDTNESNEEKKSIFLNTPEKLSDFTADVKSTDPTKAFGSTGHSDNSKLPYLHSFEDMQNRLRATNVRIVEELEEKQKASKSNGTKDDKRGSNNQQANTRMGQTKAYDDPVENTRKIASISPQTRNLSAGENAALPNFNYMSDYSTKRENDVSGYQEPVPKADQNENVTYSPIKISFDTFYLENKLISLGREGDLRYFEHILSTAARILQQFILISSKASESIEIDKGFKGCTLISELPKTENEELYKLSKQAFTTAAAYRSNIIIFVTAYAGLDKETKELYRKEKKDINHWDSVLASAKACRTGGYPDVGNTNINVSLMKFDKMTPMDKKDYVGTIVHELFHVFGLNKRAVPDNDKLENEENKGRWPNLRKMFDISKKKKIENFAHMSDINVKSRRSYNSIYS